MVVELEVSCSLILIQDQGATISEIVQSSATQISEHIKAGIHVENSLSILSERLKVIAELLA